MLLEDESGQVKGVLLVILGAGGVEGFAVVFEGERIDEMKGEELELAEEVQETRTGLLDAESGVGPVRQDRLDLAGPGKHGYGVGGDRGLLKDLASRVEDAEIEAEVRSIDADEEVWFHV